MNWLKNAFKSVGAAIPKQRRPMYIILLLIFSIYITTCIFFLIVDAGALPFFVITLIVFIAVMALLMLGTVKFKHFGFKLRKANGFSWRDFLRYFLLAAAVLLVFWFLKYPGITSPDTNYQWEQATTFEINDWHPALHTLFISALAFVFRKYQFVLLFQNLVMAAGIAYLGAELKGLGFPKWAYRSSMLYIVLNPSTLSIMQYLWKDTAFGIAMLFFTVHLIDIFLSNGKWLLKPKNVVFFTLSFTAVWFMRHNGIFASFPILIALLILYRGELLKRTLTVCCACVVTFLAIKFPIYSLLGVEQVEGQTYTESVGLPMTILCDNYMYARDTMPEDAAIMMSKLADEETWQQNYTQGSYNSIKFYSNQEKVVGDTPLSELLAMTAECIEKNPYVSMRAVGTLLDMVYNPFADVEWPPSWILTMNSPVNQELGVFGKIQAALSTVVRPIVQLTKYPPIKNFVWCVGMLMLLMLFAAFFSFPRHGFKVFLLAGPMFIYNIGTMLMLCGNDYRFFYFNIPIVLPVIFTLMTGGRADRLKSVFYRLKTKVGSWGKKREKV